MQDRRATRVGPHGDWLWRPALNLLGRCGDQKIVAHSLRGATSAHPVPNANSREIIMPRSTGLHASVTLAASLLLLPAAALAFNPQPDPPGKRKQQSKSLGGPDTKGKGSWKRIHEVDEKSKSKGGWKSYHEVDKRKSK
jgi:hypothetical protein